MATTQEQSAQARSFLEGRGWNADRVNEALGSATSEQLAGYAAGQFVSRSEGGTAAAGADPTDIGEFSSSLTPEIIRQRQQAAQDQVSQQAGSLFDPRIRRATETGRKQVGTAAGASGQRAGFNLSTAESTFIQGVQNEVDDRIGEIEKAKAAYISSGNFQAIERADKALSDLEDKKQQFMLNKATLALQKQSGERADETLNLQTIETLNKIPAGQSVEVNGKIYTGIAPEDVEPIFTGSNIIDIAKQLPVGESRTIFDPGTGEEITIEGLDFNPDLGTNTIQTTSGSGKVTLTTYDQLGNIVNQVDAGQIGKAASGPGQVKDKLTQSVFNKLASKGVTEDWGRSIQHLLASNPEDTAINILAQGLQQQGGDGMSVAFSEAEKQAKNMVDTYKTVIAGESLADQLFNIFNGNGNNQSTDTETPTLEGNN
jgi:YD repeat-containing protein